MNRSANPGAYVVDDLRWNADDGAGQWRWVQKCRNPNLFKFTDTVGDVLVRRLEDLVVCL